MHQQPSAVNSVPVESLFSMFQVGQYLQRRTNANCTRLVMARFRVLNLMPVDEHDQVIAYFQFLSLFALPRLMLGKDCVDAKVQMQDRVEVFSIIEGDVALKQQITAQVPFAWIICARTGHSDCDYGVEAAMRIASKVVGKCRGAELSGGVEAQAVRGHRGAAHRLGRLQARRRRRRGRGAQVRLLRRGAVHRFILICLILFPSFVINCIYNSDDNVSQTFCTCATYSTPS